LTVSGSSATGGNAVIDSGTDVTATFTVTDSRGLTAQKTKIITMLDWQLPTAIITMQRANNFYSDTSIKCDAQYSSLDGHNTISISYACTKEGDSSASITGTLSDNVAVTKSLDNNYNWTVKFTLVDALGGQTIYNVPLSRGTPIIFFDRKRTAIGVGTFPQANKKLEIASDWSLVANGKKNQMNYLPYSFEAYGESGTRGYAKIATINIIGNSISSPIEFEIQRRLDNRAVRLYVLFNNENNTDPALVSFYYDSYDGTAGNKPNAFIYKTATSTWDVYVNKSASGDYITVYTKVSEHSQSRCNITYSQNLLSSVPSGAVTASIIPCRTVSVTVTKTSGNSTANSVAFYRSGNVCTLTFSLVTTGATNVGYNVFEGTSNAPKPVASAYTASYSGSSAVIVVFGTDGKITARVTGATLPTQYDARVTITYLTNE
jgi:hypothetical protein